MHLEHLFYNAPEAWRSNPEQMLPHLLQETGLRLPELLAQMRALNLKWSEKPVKPVKPRKPKTALTSKKTALTSKKTSLKPKFQVPRRTKPPSPREGEVLFLLLKQGSLHPKQLAGVLQLPVRTCRNILRGLARAGWADHEDLSYYLTKKGDKQAGALGEVEVRVGVVPQEELRAKASAKSQAKLLGAVTFDFPEDSKTIAQKLGVSWHWASRVLRGLEKKGLVEKLNTPGIGVSNIYVRKKLPEV